MDLELQGKHPVSKMPRERKNVKEVKKTLIAIHKVFSATFASQTFTAMLCLARV